MNILLEPEMESHTVAVVVELLQRTILLRMVVLEPTALFA